MKEKEKLIEALLRGEGFDAQALETVGEYISTLRRALEPMESWEAPFVVAACKTIIEDTKKQVPTCEQAAAELLRLLEEEKRGDN